MSAGLWLPLLRRAAPWLVPWLLVALLALACRHYAAVATTRAQQLASQDNAFRAAQAQAQLAAGAARARQEEHYRQQAQAQEIRHDQELQTARAAAARYAAAHRVQPAPLAGAAGPADTAPADRPAGVREGLPAAGVVVSQDDVQACTEVTAYALSLREWALGIGTSVTAPMPGQR